MTALHYVHFCWHTNSHTNAVFDESALSYVEEATVVLVLRSNIEYIARRIFIIMDNAAACVSTLKHSTT